MLKNKDLHEIQALIHMGKQRGYVTYEEMNNFLPTHLIGTNQLEDMMIMFSNLDIEVVNSLKKRHAAAKRGYDSKADQTPAGRSTDPVRMYLRKMGRVSLLSRQGEIEIAKRKEEEIPDGWAIDAEGHPTKDPDGMIEGGAQLPLGSTREMGGHKGTCLAAMVDILTCVLSGANWGPLAPPFALRQEIPERSVGKGIGHFFGAMRIDGFIEPDEFKRQMDDWVRTYRATKPQPGTPGVVVPGDPEREAEAVRAKEGIPLVMPVVEDLRDIASQTGIAFD